MPQWCRVSGPTKGTNKARPNNATVGCKGAFTLWELPLNCWGILTGLFTLPTKSPGKSGNTYPCSGVGLKEKYLWFLHFSTLVGLNLPNLKWVECERLLGCWWGKKSPGFSQGYISWGLALQCEKPYIFL